MDSFSVGQLWVDRSGKLYRIDEISPGEELNSLHIVFSEWSHTRFKPSGAQTAGRLRKSLYRYVGIAWPCVPDGELACFALPVENASFVPYSELAELTKRQLEPAEIVDLMAALKESLRMK